MLNCILKFLKDYEAIIAAIIQAAAIIVGIIIGFYQYKYNKWNESISKERTVWLKEFRTEVGLIMKAYSAMKINNSSNSNEAGNINETFLKIILDAEEARYKLITRINTNNDIYGDNKYNVRYKELLLIIDMNHSNIFINNSNFEEFIDLTNRILENEWQKVKREARGKVNER